MKNKSMRHKDLNTFKFVPFSERISNIDIDVFHKVDHEYESPEEITSYFHQAIEKWEVMNLTDGYKTFLRELKPYNYITLPQVLLYKDHIVEVLLKHLREKNPAYLQPLLEIVVAVAKDLQKEFYPYYSKFLEILIDLLNTKDPEQLEWTFTCLAYVFKFLWRPLIKDITSVFITLLPLLSDSKPDYINSFAAESFAFVARKVKDRKSFLSLLLNTVQSREDGVIGSGKLLFEVIKGIDGQFHSCAETIFPFLLKSLSDETLPQNILFSILEHVVQNIVLNIQSSKNELFWNTLLSELKICIDEHNSTQKKELLISSELLLKLVGQSIEHKAGRFLQKPGVVIETLSRLLNDSTWPESMMLTITQIGILLLLSRNIRLSQEQASSLTRKMLTMQSKKVFLYFVDNISEYSSFEALILPSFLKYCGKNWDEGCFHILVKLILKKAPICQDGIKLEQWRRYSLDFKEYTSTIRSSLTEALEVEEVQNCDKIDNYVCSLICLPHINWYEPYSEALGSLENKVTYLVNRLKVDCTENKKILFLLNSTLECLIHLAESDRLIRIFHAMADVILEPELIQQYVCLKILSLFVTSLKDSKEFITMNLLMTINNLLEKNFGSPFHEVRLLTAHIYATFENLEEFRLKYSTDPDVEPENWKVFSICYSVESVDPQIDSYRNQLQNLESFSSDKPQVLMCNQTVFKAIPLRYLCGVLYVNFRLIWEPVMKIIATHAKGMEINTFWAVFGEELKCVYQNIWCVRQEPDTLMQMKLDFLSDLYQESQKFKVMPDFNNYRMMLWKSMAMFANVAEAKTRDVSELLLSFVEREYFRTNSESAPALSIKQKQIKGDEEEVDTEHDDSQTVAKKEPSRKLSTRTLLYQLNVFSQVRSPMSMYREPELYKLYFDLLQHRDSSIQKAALDCLMTYKHKYLTSYKEQLYGLVDDKNFKNVLTTFRINYDSEAVLPEHREHLIPLLMQLVFSKMSSKTGMRTRGKSSSQLRRNLVLKFLAGCESKEMLIFLQKALKLYDKYMLDNPTSMVNSVLEMTDLDKFVPPKRLLSTVNLLKIIFEQFGGLMSNDVLTYLLRIIFIVGSLLKAAFERIEQVHVGYLQILKNLRTSCVKLISDLFKNFDRYPWTNDEINSIFELFVWPLLEKLNVEGIHSPTALLKLFVEWGSNPRYFSLLVKYKEGDEGNYVLPQVVRLLVNEKSHFTVVLAIEEMLEKLLTLVPDEDDMLMTIPVDNLLPIQDHILQKVGVLDRLNYGSCILLPHVPLILEKIQRKMNAKSKHLNVKELFILTRISELVWESDMSNSVLEVLLPIALKKCSLSAPEEMILKYLISIQNLIKNVDEPKRYLMQIFPFFGEVSYPSCRKKLCEILEMVTSKLNDAYLKKASDLAAELNAWDPRWVSQPDFEKRHMAFKQIQADVVGEDIDVSLGVLVIHNCFFFIRNESDLASRENASYTLRQICVFLIKNAPKHADYILNDIVYPSIRRGIKINSKNDFRNECITLLGHLARSCPESHFVLKDLHLVTNEIDLEVDFFANLVHLQLHRHARALLKFCQVLKEQETAPSSRTLTQFVLPLVSHYLCNKQFVGKNSVIDAAVETVGVICRILPWHQYEGILTFYLAKLNSKSEYQKQLVKIIVAILDAFHFDLTKGTVSVGQEVVMENSTLDKNVVSEQNRDEAPEEEVKNSEETEGTVDIDDYIKEEDSLDESDAEEVDEGMTKEKATICTKILVLCKSASTRAIRTINMILLPKLHKSLAELTRQDNSHKINRKKTSFEQEEEDLHKVPIFLAIVKLLQRLPVHILDANMPGVFMKICTFLKSHLESVRRIARETLQKIMLTLGPQYLNVMLAEMTPLLSRGYQAHVLVFTVHGVLSSLKGAYQPGDVDKVLLTVLNLCTADLFGILAEEKEIAKIAVKVSEARHSKTFDTFQILANYITKTCLLDLILPIKQVSEKSHSYKSIQRAEEALRYIALGLVDNEFIPTEALLRFAYGTASENIPQLLPKTKEPLSEKEVRKLQIVQEDCFIIPKVPDNRAVYRKQNVKTSLKTNAHILVAFGLRLCYTLLKREKVKDERFKTYIDPFVMLFKRCIKSKHVKLCTLTLQCLIWVFKFDLPSLRQNIKSITKDIFNILHKYSSAGMSKGDNFDLVVSTFKAVAVLVRDVKYHHIDTTQMKTLLLYAEEDINNHDRQATAFGLLKAIIGRKIIVPEIHDVMQKVAELSITSELSHVRAQSRAVFQQFMMDYPMGNKLDDHIGFYLAQMSFDYRFGRESAIEMIQMLINSFPVEVVRVHSGSLLISLGARLVNEEEPECKKMLTQCICSMLTKLPKLNRDPLFDIVVVWFKDKNITHCQLAAQLCGLFVTTEKSSFDTRLPTLFPLIMRQFGLDQTPGKFVRLKKDEINDSEEHQKLKDHHLFQVLQLVLKLCMYCPAFLKNDGIENLALQVQVLLSYPHDWVRLAAAQFLGYVLAGVDIEHLSQLILTNKAEASGFLVSDPTNTLKSLTLDLCDQLQLSGIKSNFAEQVVKNLIFVAKVLQDIPMKTNQDFNTLNLLWLTKRMRKVVNTEIVENSASIVLRTEIFKWIAGVVTALDVERIKPVLHHLLAPLVREMITTEEKNAPLRQLAKEVSNLVKKKLGMEEYTRILSRLQQNLSAKKAERKRQRSQLAVTDPEVYAKKKIKRHEKKKETKKRKIDVRKGGGKRNFKRRKVLDLEDNSDIV